MTEINFTELLEAGVHFGHSQRYWNAKMAPYLYGVRRKIHIINVLKTKALFQRALTYMEKICASHGKILFVATKRQAQDMVKQEAERIGMPYVNKRWPGGMLTNFKTIRQSVDRMKSLEAFLQTDQVYNLKKKERLSIERDLNKLKASFDGIRDMNSLPDCLFVIDVGQEHIAVREANKLGIPVVGIVDTNCSPDGVDYIIPGNDDSQKAVALYLKIAADLVYKSVSKLKAAEQTRAVVLQGKEVKVIEKLKKGAGSVSSGNDDKASSKDSVEREQGDNVATDTKKHNKTQDLEPTKKVIKVSVDQARKAQEKGEEGAKEKPNKPKAVARKKTDTSKKETTEATEAKAKKKADTDKASEAKAKKKADTDKASEAKAKKKSDTDKASEAKAKKKADTGKASEAKAKKKADTGKASEAKAKKKADSDE